jgi:AcrR family transcriptional regulator
MVDRLERIPSVRKIAAEADVNVAAVNYHFGSKDRVMFAALQTLRARFGEAFAYLRAADRPPRERLVAFMTAYCDTVFEYPNLVKAFVNQSLNAEIQQDYESFLTIGSRGDVQPFVALGKRLKEAGHAVRWPRCRLRANRPL